MESLRDGAPILLALDGRPDSAGPIRLASALSRRYGNDVRVVTVLEPLPRYVTNLEPYPDELLWRRMAHVRSHVMTRVTIVLGREYNWPVTVAVGRVAEEVSAAAEACGAGAIVIGIGHHQAIDRMLHSETSINIVTRSSLPTIAVPEWVTTLPRIAVAGTDFGASSLIATQTALDCLALPASMTLLHATPVFDPMVTDPDFCRRCRQAVPDLFVSMVRQLEGRPGVALHTAMVSGNPAAEMLAKADECQADLLVVGRGTMATRLLRAARAMVLIAPGLPRGQRERESAAAAERTLDPNPAAMRFDDAARDRETQSR